MLVNHQMVEVLVGVARFPRGYRLRRVKQFKEHYDKLLSVHPAAHETFLTLLGEREPQALSVDACNVHNAITQLASNQYG